MKRATSLPESRTAIRLMFAAVVKEMYNASIKSLTPEQLLAAIRKTAEQVTIVHIPDGSNDTEVLKNAFKEEITILNKAVPTFKTDVTLIWKSAVEVIAEISETPAPAPVSDEVPFAQPEETENTDKGNEFPSDADDLKPIEQPALAPEYTGKPITEKDTVDGVKTKKPASNPSRKSIQEAFPGKQIDLNKMEVNGKVYIAILTAARSKYIESKNPLTWEKWVDSTYHEYKGTDLENRKKADQEKPAAEIKPVTEKKAKPVTEKKSRGIQPIAKSDSPVVVPPVGERGENESATDFFTRKFKACQSVEELQTLIDTVNSEANRQVVFVHTESGKHGVITGTKTNARTGKPVLKVTLSDGAESRSFCEIFTRYFSLIEDSAEFAKMTAEIVKK